MKQSSMEDLHTQHVGRKPTESSKSQSPQQQTVPPAAVWQTVPQDPVLPHQARGQFHPSGHKTVEVLSSKLITMSLNLHQTSTLYLSSTYWYISVSLFLYYLFIPAHRRIHIYLFYCLFTSCKQSQQYICALPLYILLLAVHNCCSLRIYLFHYCTTCAGHP